MPTDSLDFCIVDYFQIPTRLDATQYSEKPYERDSSGKEPGHLSKFTIVILL